MMSVFIDEYAHVSGPEDASATLLVLTDFQCPGCKVLADSLAQIQAAHPADIRLIVRYLPDGRYDKSILAMQAAEAAQSQGKFWEMYSLLFAKQPEWYAMDPAEFPAWIRDQAAGLDLDVDLFEDELLGEEVAVRVQQAIEQSSALGVLPPLLYINNVSPYAGMADTSSLDQTVRLAILDGKKFHTCPLWSVDPLKQYIVSLETSRGEVALQLFPEKAPLAVNNFIFLIKQGWYDNIPFHRVDEGFVIQAGDPSGTGYGNPGYYFATEFAPGVSFDRAGILAMANVGTDTNGSQFFITYAPAPQLDGQFTIFGEVLVGMEILESMSPGDLILKVSVEEH